jgi:flagellar hook-associated protein 2
VKVSKLAAAQYVTSAKLGTYTDADTGEAKSVTSKTKLSDLGFQTDGSSQIQIETADKTVNLNVDENTTVSDFVQSLKDAGLNASYDETQGRFFIGASSSGASSSFKITSNSFSDTQMEAVSGLKTAVGYDSLSDTQKSTVKDIFSNLQNDNSTEARTSAVKTLTDMLDANAKTAATSYYKSQLTDQYTSQYITQQQATDENGDLKYDEDGTTPIMEDVLTPEGEAALEASGLLKEGTEYTSAEKLKLVQDKLISKNVTADMKSDEYQGKISNAVTDGLAEAGIAGPADRYASVSSAVDNYADSVAAGVAKSDVSALQLLGMDNIDGSAVAENADGSGMAVIAASDSVVQVNGATLTSSNTTLNFNGLTLDLVSASEDPVTITVSNDTSAVYDSIKEFVNQYNSILADLNEYYYADSSKGYDPLTDDQKEEMSDDEIEKWETKIKDSLLRRDSTLGGILDTMRNTMTGYSVTASNGKSYSLANLGITTGSDYTEYGLLHIKGDEDDEEYADSTNTLQSMIESDPDTVSEVLTGVISNLYSNLSKKMQSTTMSSALTFYNDKEMSTQLTSYKKEISEWETKLADMEDRYYSQFTAMETALTKLQSQQSALSSYLG